MFCRSRALFLIPLLVLAAGCSRSKPVQGPSPRLAVLRCENLSGDASLDWMGRAFSELLSYQLSQPAGGQTVPLSTLRAFDGNLGRRPPAAPGISAEREAALSAGAGRLVTCEVSATGGVLRLAAQIQDTASLRMVGRAAAEGPLSGGVFPVAESAARQLGASARPYATKQQGAMQAYAEGLDATDPAAASAAEARAVAADPNFGPAYVTWVQAEAARGDRAGAERVIEMAAARGKAIGDYERARLALDAAELHNDPVGRMQALSSVAKLGPPDPSVYRALAEAALQGRRYRDAIAAYEKALALAPDDVALLNALGYAQAYLGDLAKALEPLRKYEKLQPTQANPIDSQADVYFYSGHYAEAEKSYLAAQQKDPNFLGGAEILKAAQARLYMGDIPGADAIFQRYAGVLEARHDVSTDYRKAQWSYLTGRRREAIAMLSRQAAQSPQFDAQLAIWELQLGDRTAADRAARAVAAVHGNAPIFVGVAAFLTQPANSEAEWKTRAERMVPPALRDQMIAYGLLFHSQFRDALPYLRRTWDQSNPTTEEGLPVLLAWAMIESGQWDGMTSFVGPTPIPSAGGPGPLVSLYFPRLFYLRARNFERLGQKEQAQENYKLFLKLSGNDAEIWGEEKRARDALGH